MRTDKARLPMSFGSLAHTIADTVQNIVGNVALVGSKAKHGDLGLDCLDDLRPGLGPLSGIETALASRRARFSLIAACDMPGIKTNWLNLLLERAESSHRRCLICCDREGKLHPLCGIYREDCLPDISRALDRGQFRLLDCVRSLEAEPVYIEDRIWNVNSPEDWSAWQAAEAEAARTAALTGA